MKQDNTNKRIDKGWSRMVLTLDEQMPVKDDKDRRFILLFWIFTGIIAISLLYVGLSNLSNPSNTPYERNINIVEGSDDLQSEQKTNTETISTEISAGKNDSNNTTGSEAINKNVTTQSVTSQQITITDRRQSTIKNNEDKEVFKQHPETIQGIQAGSVDTDLPSTHSSGSSIQAIQNPDNEPTLAEALVATNESFEGYSVIQSPEQLKKIPPFVDQDLIPLTLDYGISFPAVELNNPVQLRFAPGIDALASRATDLKMWGVQGRVNGTAFLNNSSIGLFGGFGHLWKSPKTIQEDASQPNTVEDVDQAISEYEENPGKTSQELLSSLDFFDFGLSMGHQLARPVSFEINGGLTKYFSVNPVSVQRVDSGALGAALGEPFEILIEDQFIPFAELSLKWNITQHIGFNVGYHHEFKPVIKQADATFHGHRVNAGIGFLFN